MVWGEKCVYAIVMLINVLNRGQGGNFAVIQLSSFIHSYCGGGCLKFFKKTLPQALALLFLELCFCLFTPLSLKKCKKKNLCYCYLLYGERMFSIH